jgi:hypothetical protein
LLQGDAGRLAPTSLASATEVAESLLGFSVVAAEPLATKAKNALALQVSFMARQGFVDAFAVSSESRGSRSEAYRNLTILPAAQTLADDVNIGTINTVRTLRPINHCDTGTRVIGARDVQEYGE